MQGNAYNVQEVVLSKADFPLPTLGPKLEAIRENVRIGRGFQLIKYACNANPHICEPRLLRTQHLWLLFPA